MNSIKESSKWRITSASLALTAFVLYSLYDIFWGNKSTLCNTYDWRLIVFNFIFLFAPYIAILAFSIMDRKLKKINRRIFVGGLFGIYLIQAILLLILDESVTLSILCCSWVQLFSYATIVILTIRIVMLLLIPVAHKVMLKSYSIGMISFLTITFIWALSSDYCNIRINTKEILAFIADILFHVSLFFFSELLDNENVSEQWLNILGKMTYIIFGNYLEDDSKAGDIHESQEGTTSNNTNYALEYKVLFINALNEEDKDLIKSCDFIRDLANEKLYDSDKNIFSMNDYLENLTIIADKIEEMNLKKKGIISEEFVNLINMLIAENTEASFKTDVIAVAKLLFDDNYTLWINATKKYYDINKV